MTVTLKETGRRIAALRAAKGLGQVELAAEIGCSRSAIAGIESGNDRGGMLLMTALADYFKVSLDWLIGRTVPHGGPLTGQFVQDPDELAWLDFWRGLNDAERATVIKLLRPPGLVSGAA